jgi:hypothetical protein
MLILSKAVYNDASTHKSRSSSFLHATGARMTPAGSNAYPKQQQQQQHMSATTTQAPPLSLMMSGID